MAVPQDLQAAIAEEIRPEEILLWSGEPQAMPKMDGLIFAGVMMGIFCLIGFVLLFIFAPLGLFFLLFIGFMFVRIYIGLERIQMQAYAVTSQRVIIRERRKPYRTRTLNPVDLRDIERKGAGPLHTLRFIKATPRKDETTQNSMPLNMFHQIKEARVVESLIQNTFFQKKDTPS